MTALLLFVLSERIEWHQYELLEILVRAMYTKHPQELLRQANVMLKILRFQRRLGKGFQCIKVKGYCFDARAIDEISKLVGC